VDKKEKTVGEALTESQLRARAKDPAQLLAQLAAPILVALMNAPRERTDQQFAERAVELAELLHEAALKRAMAELAKQPHREATSNAAPTGSVWTG
jgi:hypothetical protein